MIFSSSTIFIASILFNHCYGRIINETEDTIIENPLAKNNTNFVRRATDNDAKIRKRISNTTKDFMIVGGTVAESNRYKYYCNLFKNNNNRNIRSSTPSLVPICGCTIIAQNVVLTAAHCAIGNNDIVEIGNAYLTKEENEEHNIKIESFKIIDKKVHPLWNRKKFDYDVMILKLNGNSNIKPIKLRLSKERKRRGGKYTVMGFGAMSYRDSTMNSYSNILREVQINYIKNSDCDEIYEGYITESMVCAYAPGKDACIGDSGGPLIVKKTSQEEDIQIGIVSWGYDCGVFPGVYAYLPNKDIKDFLHKGVCHVDTGFSRNSISCKEGFLTNVI